VSRVPGFVGTHFLSSIAIETQEYFGATFFVS